MVKLTEEWRGNGTQAVAWVGGGVMLLSWIDC